MDLTPAAGWLRERLLNLKERNPYLAEDDTFARILHLEARLYEVAPYLWIRINACCSYDTEAPWADYTEYTHCTEEYSWVGLIEGAPDAPSREQLDAWSLLKTRYAYEDDKEDTQHTYTHEGERVSEVSAYRGVVLQTADGIGKTAEDRYRFQEEARSFRALREARG